MNSTFNNMNDLDSLVVVPVISLNPKKAKKKLKKAARSEENDCMDSRLPVDKMLSDSIEVVSVPLSSTSSKAKRSKPLVEKTVMSPTRQAEFTPIFEGNKKSWYDITVDDDDDFLLL
eukprot:gnl/MRDRNA2_/MRDRNA2_88382_c0_seq1.p1 gnl/MRDRNA2_/MRDRNA2_88382_c0~~gnl/MRDRNA2_/MRDRNA2_88382_c0_seq1.p1  ORF type:complete len:117 (+),score=31.27 gnl/MRDRNA2_/MRDRNA2_88382_c0_seq1:110-460(+)